MPGPPQNNNNEERRSSPRAPLVAKVEAEATGHSFLAVTADVSAGGMRIHTANPLPVVAELRLRFVLPGPEGSQGVTIETGAVVRYVVEGTAMGVEFTSLDPAARAALARFVSS